MKQINTKKLLADLISIPSYLSKSTSENKIINYLYNFISDNFPEYKVSLEYFANKRPNLIATNSTSPKILFINHVDSVTPDRKTWKQNPCEPSSKDNRIIGLGSTDTKGNIAAFLAASLKEGLPNNSALIFYGDEEYSFQGMKSLVKSKLLQKWQPEYIISLDGAGNTLETQCPNIYEINFEVFLQSKHSKYSNGNEITDYITNYISWVKEYLASSLEKSSYTLNIADIRCGTETNIKNNISTKDIPANLTPSYISILLELRTLSKELDLKLFKKVSKSKLLELGAESVIIKTKLENLGFSTNLKKVTPITNDKELRSLGVKLNSKQNMGYFDLAILSRQFPKATCFSLGITTEGQAHKPNEYVLLRDLNNGEKIYTRLLWTIKELVKS